MIRWSYLFFALIASFSVIISSVFSESLRFSLLDNLEDPFHDMPRFSGENSIKAPTEEVFLWRDFLLFLQDEVEMKTEGFGLRLQQGESIISTKFSIENDRFYDPELPFIPQKNLSKKNWIQVGPLWIDLFRSTISIERDAISKVTYIQTTDHQVAVYFEGAMDAIILPAGSYATIYDDFVSEKTNLLSFSKLKKEWRINPAEENTQIQKFQIIIKSIFRKSQHYAQDLPKSWMWGEPGSNISDVLQKIKKLQSIYAIGYKKEMEDDRFFLATIQPFLEAQNTLYKEKEEVVEEKLRETQEAIKKPAWKNLLKNSPEQQERWNTLKFYQNIWLQNSLRGSEEWPFRMFWENIADTEPSWEKQILLDFLDLERLIFNQDYLEILAQVEFIQGKINNHPQKLSEGAQSVITRIRRQTHHLIQTHQDLKDTRIYQFYGQLIVKEVANKSHPKFTDISLENAQDIIALTQHLLQEEGNQEYLDILISTYQSIDIIKIQRKLGRNIFSPQELEMINLIKSIGETGLTPKEIEKIKQKNQQIRALQEESQKIYQESASLISNPDNTPVANPQVWLKNMLKEKGFNADFIEIKTIEKGTIYNIEELLWKNQKLEVIFSRNSQKFIQAKLPNNQTLKHITPEVLIQQLQKINQKSASNAARKSLQEIIPQTTSEALLVKKIIEQLLAHQELNITRKNITAIDREYENFRIKDVTYGRYLRVSFNYQKSSGNITDLLVDAGRIKLDFTGPYQKTEMIKLLEEESRAILNR